jgi:hypothetical protein
MRRQLLVATCSVLSVELLRGTPRASAAPLLAVDFGRAVENPVQSGFFEMAGTSSQAAASATFGSYSVDLAGQGFADSNNGTAVDASVRPLYRDYYYNNSDVNGVGVALSIGGVIPNHSYNLTLWSYDADQVFSSTPTTWTPTGNSSGAGGSITDFATPRPTTLNDYSVTFPVSSTTSTLQIFGTTTAGSGGTRLNAFRLMDGAANALAVDFGVPSPPPSPTQAGFVGMSGLQIQSSATQTIGAYNVTVKGQGFEDTSTGNANAIDASVRDLYRDTYYNNSDVNGVGVTLTIDGVTPNTDYDVTLWSYDAAQSFSSTETVWGPSNSTTGASGTITNFATPRPASLSDRSTTIRVRSSTNTLTLFGTTTSGFGGTRLNGFQINAVVPEPTSCLLIALGMATWLGVSRVRRQRNE